MIGGTRTSSHDGTTERRTVQESLRRPTPAGHLGFALKHEGVHLETLSRLFATAPRGRSDYLNPRRTHWPVRPTYRLFYELLTGRQLDIPPITRGNYVDALDPARELTLTTASNNSRWRVRDNLLGSPALSPQVHRTPDTQRALTFVVCERIACLEGQFSAELLMRSAAWLTIKESRSSFAIEHEENKRDRVQRFAAVIEQRTGQSPDPLAITELESFQRENPGAGRVALWPATLTRIHRRVRPIRSGARALHCAALA